MKPDAPAAPEVVALHEVTRHRYLNYALSVITARALPDVRDGLKPVQRRILYAMHANLHLQPNQRYRKSAAVVGEVMARYHPHGDSSIYDALVRMAQPFSLRHPLVDGQGNFGSIDGDPPAAMRYTECKLMPLAGELLSEIRQRTVEFRPNYDGQHSEPVVLPAQFPQLLVNGAEGIAVGMATRIPPHNLREVIDAATLLIDDPEATVERLARKIKGPDFPTGAVIQSTPEELRQIYADGSGSIRVRARWEEERQGRKASVVVTEIPFAVNKANLVEKIGQLVNERKLPQVLDVRDESTETVRIVMELRKPEDATAAMAFLFKHTALSTPFHVNLTCLVPTEIEGVLAPERCDLRSMLRHWLDFRYETVRKRFQFDLEELRREIHRLEGFVKIFDFLDEAIALIRKSEGKRDAAEKLMTRFDLDDVQADAILELKLHQLARLAILEIRERLAECKAEAARIEAILSSSVERWAQVKSELGDIRKQYGEPRRTLIGGEEAEHIEYSETNYIVEETAWVFVTRDGWIKRQLSFTDVDRIRMREGDSIGWMARVGTRSHVAFFSSHGGAYVLRVDDVPATTGYGEPVQRHFTFADGERVVGVVFFGKGALPPVSAADLAAAEANGEPPPPYGISVTRGGRIARFSLDAHREISNKAGRRYMRPDGPTDAVLAVYPSDGTEQVSLASELGRAVCFAVSEANLLKGPGKGVTALSLHTGDRMFAFELTTEAMSGVVVTTQQGREEVIRPNKFAGPRGGKGRVVLKRGKFVEWAQPLMRFDQLYQRPEGPADESPLPPEPASRSRTGWEE